jgi:hypothetical protein
VSQSHRWKATERTINANVTAAKNKLNRNPNDAECLAQLEYAQALQDECLEDSAIGRDHHLWPLRVKSFYAQLQKDRHRVGQSYQGQIAPVSVRDHTIGVTIL